MVEVGCGFVGCTFEPFKSKSNAVDLLSAFLLCLSLMVHAVHYVKLGITDATTPKVTGLLLMIDENGPLTQASVKKIRWPAHLGQGAGYSYHPQASVA
jgi:hypothetical protein